MTKSFNTGEISVERQPFGPLVEILQRGLRESGIELDEEIPVDTEAFAEWYLTAVQSLEAVVAARDRHAPMSRREIILLCRCALTASNLREAILLAIEFCEALSPRGGKLNLSISDNQAIFTMDSLRNEVSIASSLIDVTGLYAFYQLFSWLIGKQLILQSVKIGHGQRESNLPFLKLFGAPVLTGSKVCTLIFSEELLIAPVIRLNSELPAFVARFPCDVLGVKQNGLTQQIQAIISAAIQQNAIVPTMSELASTLEIPESTLRRKLIEDGTSFSEIKTESLFEAARYLLLRDSYTIEQIAHRLGFGDDTAFRRAFKSWAGMSPSAWSERSETTIITG